MQPYLLKHQIFAQHIRSSPLELLFDDDHYQCENLPVTNIHKRSYISVIFAWTSLQAFLGFYLVYNQTDHFHKKIYFRYLLFIIRVSESLINIFTKLRLHATLTFIKSIFIKQDLKRTEFHK